MGNFRFIAIGGVARAGKDTLCQIIQSHLKTKTKRIALADALKLEMDPYLRSHFGISAFTSNPEEKKLVRDLFVAHAAVRRRQTQGTYWTKLVTPELHASIANGEVPIVTDIRYSEYDEDELFWVKFNGGLLVHLARRDKDGQLICPANTDEMNNDPKIRANAVCALTWNTHDTQEEMKKDVDCFLSMLPWK